MKAKEFIPATKPRNFVAKNQKTAGAGAHRDKKRDEKQGNVKHKRDLMPMEAGWKDEAEDVGEWTDYVKERLTKASPEQRLSLAKKLSQVEVKNFGSSLGGGFDRNTGKAKTGELTDTVRSALRSISAGRSSDGDGPAGNFSMPFGSVDIPGMENATPEELAVMKKAVMMGPQVAGAAAKLYRKNGTITSQDLKGIESDFEKASGIEFGKPMYSSPEAKASRERAMAGEGMGGGVDAKGRTQQQWLKLVKAKFPTARIMQARMIDGPITATLDDGRKLSWKKVEQPGAKPTQQSRWQVADKVAEGAEQMTPHWAKYVLDQIYNSNGEVTLTDLFDEGIPGLHDMFMDTAKRHGLDPEEDFEDVQHELTVELEDLIKGGDDLEEGTPGNDFRVGQRVIYTTGRGEKFPSIVTAVDFDEDAVKIRSANNKPFPNNGGDIEMVVDPGWKFLTAEPRVDPDSIIAVSPSMRKTTERVRDPEDWDEGNTEPPNNFAVYINGKKWKVFKGRGQYADDAREQAHYEQLKGWAAKKSAATGKQWSVSITGEPATE